MIRRVDYEHRVKLVPSLNAVNRYDKQQRNRYSDEFKAEVLKLAENASMASAARALGLHELQIYGWRSTARKKAHSLSRKAELVTENARLRRQLSEQTAALAILKKSGYLLREEPKNSALPLAELASQAERYDVKTVGASMQRQSLLPKSARKFNVTTDSNHSLSMSPNLLEAAIPN